MIDQHSLVSGELFSGFELASEAGIAPGQTIMGFQKKQAPAARQPLDEPALYEYAVRSLGRRMRTEAELRRLMRQRVEEGEPGESKMAAVVERLKEHNYLDDARYAADYTRTRQENQRFGRRRVQQELGRRGIHKEIAGAALDAAYEGVPELDLARKYVERKRLRQPTNDKETARVVGSLVRAGFSMTAVFAMLKSWRVDDSAISAVAEMDLDPPDRE